VTAQSTKSDQLQALIGKYMRSKDAALASPDYTGLVAARAACRVYADLLTEMYNVDIEKELNRHASTIATAQRD
jgi:hypothetical protein